MDLNYEKSHGFKQFLQTQSMFLAGLQTSSYMGLFLSLLPAPCAVYLRFIMWRKRCFYI